MEDADPLEGECTKRSLMGATALAVAFIEGLGPEGTRDGLANPLDEGLALKGWAGEAPVDPALVAAALGDWGDADVLLEGSSVWEPFSALTESNQQARSECGPSTGERVEELEVGELGAERSDLGVEAFDCGVDGVELRDGGLDEQQERVDDGRVGGQWFFGLNGIDASGDGVLAPDVVSLEEGDERVMPSVGSNA
jgi:hypothetical protein